MTGAEQRVRKELTKAEHALRAAADWLPGTKLDRVIARGMILDDADRVRSLLLDVEAYAKASRP